MELATDKDAAPALSVVLVTPDSFALIRKAVRFLRAQSACGRIELILVAPSRATLGLCDDELAGFAAVKVIEFGSITAVASPKVAAVRQASAPIVAFAEDHCYPEPAWAQALLDSFADPAISAAAPVIANANPRTLLSWTNLGEMAGYLLGAGNVEKTYARFEMGRINHLCASDRAVELAG